MERVEAQAGINSPGSPVHAGKCSKHLRTVSWREASAGCSWRNRRGLPGRLHVLDLRALEKLLAFFSVTIPFYVMTFTLRGIFVAYHRLSTLLTGVPVSLQPHSGMRYLSSQLKRRARHDQNYPSTQLLPGSMGNAV